MYIDAKNPLTNTKEIFKDIPDYKGFYQISDMANVKSLERTMIRSNGKPYYIRERILIPGLNSKGYNSVCLSKDGKTKNFNVSQLVAMSFLAHKPNGHTIVVDHKNNIPTDDRLENLQLLTQRQNTSKDRKGYSSQYIGVGWHKPAKKWIAQIQVNCKLKYLGYFVNELDAAKAYQNKLAQL